MALPEKKNQSFLYFAYGSNLSTERIHINNPSAKSIAIAKLDVSISFNCDFIRGKMNIVDALANV